MRSDHRRPLVAYVLVTLACAFVVAPSLDFGGLGGGSTPTFSAFPDTMRTPSEIINPSEVIDPSDYLPAPDSEPADEPRVEDDDPFVPAIDVIEDAVGGPLFSAGDSDPVTTTGDVGSQSPEPDVAGSQVIADSPVDGSGSSGEGNVATAGLSDPDLSNVSGGPDGPSPSDGGPDSVTAAFSPGQGHGPKDQAPKDPGEKSQGPKHQALQDPGEKSHGPKHQARKDPGEKREGPKHQGSKHQGSKHQGDGKAHKPKGPKKAHHGRR